MTIKKSMTLIMNSLAQEKVAKGEKVYNCSAGEPRLPTPTCIIDGVKSFISTESIFYPDPAGAIQLRKAITQWINSHYLCNYSEAQCAVTVGGKQGLYLLLQYLLQKYIKEMNTGFVGEFSSLKKPAVMIAKPFWVSYRDIVQLFDGAVSYIETTANSGWKMTLADLESAYNSDCRILLLNNGCNPSGALYNKQELANTLAFAKKNNLYVISDEVYSGLVYDDYSYVSCGSFSEYQDIVCVLQSCSKNFAMTGWRVGFLFAQPEVVQVIIALLSQSTTGVSLVNQHAAYVAIENSDEIMKDIKHQMQIRRDAMMFELRKNFNHFAMEEPHSALYVFVSLKQLGVKTDISDSDFSLQLLDQANVATVPGSAFGVPGYIRISFTATLEDIAVAVAKLADFCKKV